MKRVSLALLVILAASLVMVATALADTRPSPGPWPGSIMIEDDWSL